MEEDISRKVVLVLVIVAVVISILSTILVLNSVYRINAVPLSRGGQAEPLPEGEASAVARLSVGHVTAAAPPISVSTGRVRLNVIK